MPLFRKKPVVTYADHLAAVGLHEEELNAEWAAAMDAAVAAAQREGANQGYLNGVATNADDSFKAGVKAARETVTAAYAGHWDEEHQEIYRDADPNIGLRAIDGLEKP